MAVRLSVVTPTHNPAWISETASSLRAQEYQDWEWLIVTNGGAVLSELPAGLPVRVVEYMGESRNIGAIKNFAFNAARGDIHVELDHDDLLTPGALRRISDTFADPEVVFAYSNCAEFWDKTFEPHMFSTEYGWEYRPREFYGQKFVEMRAFPPTPLSLRHVNFAPNHVRAWRAADYRAIGGHDAGLAIADDHDLCLRFYLYGKIAWIDDCLYLYRNHDKNSWRTANGAAFNTSCQVYERHKLDMIQRWCDTEGLRTINLGGALGNRKFSANRAEVVDARNMRGVDRVCRVGSEPLPFADNSVGLLLAYDFLEHIPLGQVVYAMNDFYRVLAPGGWLISQTPSTDGRGAFQDPTHCSFWNINSFWYYTRASAAHYVPEITCRFLPAVVKNVYPNEWARENQIPYVNADLVAIKGGMRVPGLVGM